MRLFCAAGPSVFLAASASTGCTLAVNLDALDNGGQSVDAAPRDSTVALDAGESSDSSEGRIDSSGPSVGALEGSAPDVQMSAPADGSGNGQEAALDAIDSDLSQDDVNERRFGDGPASALDAGTDATGGADAGEAGTWCEAHRSVNTVDCHDFDEGQPVQSGFASHYYSGRYASVTSADFAPGSPPGALLLATPSLEAGAPPQDEQFNDVLAFHNKVELRFALKIVNYDPDAGYFSLFRVSYQNGTWAAEFDFQRAGANVIESSALADGGTKRSTYPAAQPSPLDAWADVDCLFDFANHTMSLSFDGVAVMSNQTIANPNQNSPTIFIQTGLNFLQGPAKPMMIYYDDIVLSTPL